MSALIFCLTVKIVQINLDTLQLISSRMQNVPFRNRIIIDKENEHHFVNKTNFLRVILKVLCRPTNRTTNHIDSN